MCLRRECLDVRALASIQTEPEKIFHPEAQGKVYAFGARIRATGSKKPQVHKTDLSYSDVQFGLESGEGRRSENP